MKDQFNNPLVNDIIKVINEQANPLVLPIVGGVNAKSLDFSEDSNDPSVHLLGYGVMRISILKKDIQRDIETLSKAVGKIDAIKLVAMLSDVQGKFSSNMYLAFKLQALADVEEFLKKPDTKRKITMMKKKSGG